MKKCVAAAIVALGAALSGSVHATPLGELRKQQVSELEFGSFRLEVALAALKDWPVPIEGASVSARDEPDRIEIVIAVRKVRAASFRGICADTLARVREFLYVDADGAPIMGRSSLNLYYHGSWRGPGGEAAFRAIDSSTRIRVDVVGQGSCDAALIKGPIRYMPVSR